MNIQAALNQMQQAGFSLKVIDDDKLSVIPGDQLTPNQHDFIRKHKYEFIKVLSQHETPKLSDDAKENIQEHLEERAAIMRFDGGLTRPEAEKQARSNMRVFHYRITDKPDAWLVMIAPGCDLDEARRSLDSRFQERLLEVNEYSYKDEILK